MHFSPPDVRRQHRASPAFPEDSAVELQPVLKQLEGHGTAQNRKVYARHGAREPMFGVSYANLESMVKQFRTDHEPALALWDTGNHDARVLATMIADPARWTPRRSTAGSPIARTTC
jgi:3-methyladenine DNA glycosylase AlkD